MIFKIESQLHTVMGHRFEMIKNSFSKETTKSQILEILCPNQKSLTTFTSNRPLSFPLTLFILSLPFPFFLNLFSSLDINIQERTCIVLPTTQNRNSVV